MPTQAPPAAQKAEKLGRDIAKTRAEMTETIDKIEYKLSPDRLKEEVKATLHETIDSVQEHLDPRRIAKQAGRNMIDIIKENPLPSLIAGLSIGWLLSKGSDGGGSAPGRGYGDRPYRRVGRGYSSDRGEEEYNRPGYGRQRRPYASGTMQGSYADEAGGQAMMERASERVHDVQERSEEWMDEAWQGTRQAVKGIEGFIYENPLAAGVIAVGLGALVGGLLPTTEQEDEWMGPARDRVLHEAKEKASDTLDKMEHVAEKAGTEVQEEARNTSDDAGGARSPNRKAERPQNPKRQESTDPGNSEPRKASPAQS